MAIRDQSYTRYDGPVRDGSAWGVIGWAGFRTYWRFWRTKLILFAVWLVPLFFGLLVIAEAALFDETALTAAGEEPGFGTIRFFLGIELYALALVYIANGCGIISDDMRHGTVQLYFSKPLTPLDYGIGKFATLFLLGAVTVIIPSTLLAVLRTAMYATSDFFGHMALLHGKALFLSVVLVALMSALVIGLSSLTRRTGYAVLALIGLLLVPMIVQVIIAISTDGSAWARMASVTGIFGLCAEAVLGGADAMPDEIPVWIPPIGVAALIGAGLGALRWRLERLQQLI